MRSCERAAALAAQLRALRPGALVSAPAARMDAERWACMSESAGMQSHNDFV